MHVFLFEHTVKKVDLTTKINNVISANNYKIRNNTKEDKNEKNNTNIYRLPHFFHFLPEIKRMCKFHITLKETIDLFPAKKKYVKKT